METDGQDTQYVPQDGRHVPVSAVMRYFGHHSSLSLHLQKVKILPSGKHLFALVF